MITQFGVIGEVEMKAFKLKTIFVKNGGSTMTVVT